ncbi:T9SS type A sorting domain-containing protein [Parasediminibacterium sp. JCM 36343]|uniref:T9SS type A sorting domain-containing protein n=1 Tax=Parasediminibacterium sp. JCM 36343 TaxID=3374279 RepID=UPI00397ACEEB
MKKIYLIILLFCCFIGANATEGNYYGDGPIKVVRFYPNPATSIINFEFKNIDNAYTLQVYNFLGKKLFSQNLSNSKITIPLDNFFRGLYIYQLRDVTGNIVESGKFQVVK